MWAKESQPPSTQSQESQVSNNKREVYEAGRQPVHKKQASKSHKIVTWITWQVKKMKMKITQAVRQSTVHTSQQQNQLKKQAHTTHEWWLVRFNDSTIQQQQQTFNIENRDRQAGQDRPGHKQKGVGEKDREGVNQRYKQNYRQTWKNIETKAHQLIGWWVAWVVV